MGGDRIVVCNLSPDADEPCRGPNGDEQIAGPDSPLVVYGDTSQDAVWYWRRAVQRQGPGVRSQAVRPVLQGARAARTRTTSGCSRSPIRTTSPATTSSTPAACSRGSRATPRLHAADRRLHRLRRRGRRPDHRQPGRRPPRRRLGQRHDPRPARHRPHLRRLRRQRRHPHPRPDDRLRQPQPGTVARPAADSRPDPGRRRPADQARQLHARPGAGTQPRLMAAGDDTIYGEGSISYTVGRTVFSRSTVYNQDWTQTAYDDIVFGDHGTISQQVADTNQPDPRLQKIQTTTIGSVRGIESRAYQNGGDDTINGNEGRDVLVGGAGDDMVDGDEQDDMVFGDNIFLLRRVVEPTFPITSDYAGVTDTTSLRFQTLCGDLLYSRTDRPNAVWSARHRRQQRPAAGRRRRPQLPRSRQPEASTSSRGGPSTSSSTTRTSTIWTSSTASTSTPASRASNSWGNDYLAGGANNDLIFGQMGNDTLMGDGRIEDAANGDFHVGASRSPDGCPSIDLTGNNYTHAGTCDLVGDLDLVPSFDGVKDGQDYIEGNGGNDTVFGNDGQDDIVGGSSDFFSLTTPYLRPDGSRHVVRRQRTAHRPQRQRQHTARHGRTARPPRPRRRHDRRRQRPDHPHRRHEPLRLPRRPMRRRDAAPPSTSRSSTTTPTASRSSSAASRCSTTRRAAPTSIPTCSASASSGPCSSSGSETQGGGCSVPLPVPYGTNTWLFQGHREISGNDEIHGGWGDDFDLPRRRPRRRVRRRRRRRHHRRLGQRLDLGRHRPGRASSATTAGSSPAATATPATPDQRRARRRQLHRWHRQRHLLQRAAVRHHRLPAGRHLPREPLGAVRRLPRPVHRHAGRGADGRHQHPRRPQEDRRPHAVQPANRAACDEPKFDANNSDDVIFGGLGGELLPNYPTVIGHRNNEEPPFGQVARHRRRLPARRRGRRRDRRRRGDLERLRAGLQPDDRRAAAERLPHRLDAAVQPGRPAALRRRTPTPGTTTARSSPASASSPSTTSTTRGARSCSTPTARRTRTTTRRQRARVVPQPVLRRGPAAQRLRRLRTRTARASASATAPATAAT